MHHGIHIDGVNHKIKKCVRKKRLMSAVITVVLAFLMSGCASKADYNYFNDAKRYGNSGFDAIVQGNGDGARTQFQYSTNILQTGVREHVAKTARRAKWRRGMNTLFAVGATVGLTHAATDVSSQAQTQEQLNSVNETLSSGVDSIAQLHQAVDQQISKSEMGVLDAKARSVDRDSWRAVVISDHTIAESVVRIRTSRGHCSGFYIQPRVIATSAHCFEHGQRVEVHHEFTKEGERFLKGETYQNPVIASIRHPLFENGRSCAVRNTSGCLVFDLAFLVTKYSSSHYLPIYKGAPYSGATLAQIGYSGDLNSGFFKRIDYGCTITSIRADSADNGRAKGLQLYNDCGVYGGNSGGPTILVEKRPSGAVRIGVIGIPAGYRKTVGARVPDVHSAAYLGAAKELYKTVVSTYPGAGDADLFNGL